jgi:hypothetical protein
MIPGNIHQIADQHAVQDTWQAERLPPGALFRRIEPKFQTSLLLETRISPGVRCGGGGDNANEAPKQHDWLHKERIGPRLKPTEGCHSSAQSERL